MPTSEEDTMETGPTPSTPSALAACSDAKSVSSGTSASSDIPASPRKTTMVQMSANEETWKLGSSPSIPPSSSIAALSSNVEEETLRGTDTGTFVSMRQTSVSRVVVGGLALSRCSDPLAFLDAAWDLGCTTIDVAHVYGAVVEGAVGRWLSTRTEGAHGGHAYLRRRCDPPNFNWFVWLDYASRIVDCCTLASSVVNRSLNETIVKAIF